MAKKDEAVTFEAALARLETLVGEMESGTMDLDKMIASFEEGQRLVTFCRAKLNEVDKKIEKMVSTERGETVVEPFDPGVENG